MDLPGSDIAQYQNFAIVCVQKKMCDQPSIYGIKYQIKHQYSMAYKRLHWNGHTISHYTARNRWSFIWSFHITISQMTEIWDIWIEHCSWLFWVIHRTVLSRYNDNKVNLRCISTFDEQITKYSLYNQLVSGFYVVASKSKLKTWLILRGLNDHFIACKWSNKSHKVTIESKKYGLQRLAHSSPHIYLLKRRFRNA